MVFAIERYSAVDRWLFLAASAFCIWIAMRGVSTGEVPLKLTTIRRSDCAPLFWLGIGMNIVLGAMCLMGFIFGIDFSK